MELGRFGSGIISAHSIPECGEPAGRRAKDAVRPGIMPGYARDTRKHKRKQNYEPKASMAQRLADDSRSIWTLEDCERMTQEELMNCLRDLGLRPRLVLEQNIEEHNAGQSWAEKTAEKDAALAEKAAEKAAAKAEKEAAKAEKEAEKAAEKAAVKAEKEAVKVEKEAVTAVAGRARKLRQLH